MRLNEFDNQDPGKMTKDELEEYMRLLLEDMHEILDVADNREAGRNETE